MHLKKATRLCRTAAAKVAGVLLVSGIVATSVATVASAGTGGGPSGGNQQQCQNKGPNSNYTPGGQNNGNGSNCNPKGPQPTPTASYPTPGPTQTNPQPEPCQSWNGPNTQNHVIVNGGNNGKGDCGKPSGPPKQCQPVVYQPDSKNVGGNTGTQCQPNGPPSSCRNGKPGDSQDGNYVADGKGKGDCGQQNNPCKTSGWNSQTDGKYNKGDGNCSPNFPNPGKPGKPVGCMYPQGNKHYADNAYDSKGRNDCNPNPRCNPYAPFTTTAQYRIKGGNNCSPRPVRPTPPPVKKQPCGTIVYKNKKYPCYQQTKRNHKQWCYFTDDHGRRHRCERHVNKHGQCGKWKVLRLVA